MRKTNLYIGNKVIDPNEIIKSLLRLPPNKDRQIILIDTAISGRAASDIASALALMGHKPVIILAVDNRKGRKLQGKNLEKLYRCSDNYPELIEMPLITEDTGAALLGVSALNFKNFNKGISSPNGDLFFPQTCLWVLPPPPLGQQYAECFWAFCEYCVGSNVPDWSSRRSRIIGLISRRQISPREIQTLVPTAKGAEAIETSSHIISVTLPQKIAEKWTRDFRATIPLTS